MNEAPLNLPATEAYDPGTATIDRLDGAELARVLVDAHAAAVDAAHAAADALARAIAAVAHALAHDGRVVLVGAGTSGRLAVLDAAELPPTFGTDPARVVARIAGGERALTTAVEGAEDDMDAGSSAVSDVGPHDVTIGVSASGRAPFVRAALRRARAAGAATIGIANSPDAPFFSDAQIAITLATGAEPLAGSTRLVAGTAQKIALNTISTGAMIRLGKTYGNRMIDVVATNAKLRDRAERLVREIGRTEHAQTLLAAADGRAKVAVTMARLNCDAATARERLAASGGRLAELIGPA